MSSLIHYSMGMQKAPGFREVRDDKHQSAQREDLVQAASSRVSDLPDLPAVVHRLKAFSSPQWLIFALTNKLETKQRRTVNDPDLGRCFLLK
ncbi:hypothetical protein LSAT2_031170 [Lamellibrachia satsuma]|nr:hypothetical protein LSAT2_031170 [Lamellibrachia satsuma]